MRIIFWLIGVSPRATRHDRQLGEAMQRDLAEIKGLLQQTGAHDLDTQNRLEAIMLKLHER